MSTPDLRLIDQCDSLYLSPHADDVPLSCAARLVADASRGLRVMVLTLFGGEGGPTPGEETAWATVGARSYSAGLPEARVRDSLYRSFRALTRERAPGDAALFSEVVELLRDVGFRTRARDIYVPLGIGEHIDHRIAHEAAVAVFQSGEGRNVFLYEERPEAFVPGAVRLRLAGVGARLPPAAAVQSGGESMARFLLKHHLPPTLRGDLKGWGERLRSTREATRQWRMARRWQPLRGFGPRLQPMLYEPEAESVVPARSLAAAFASSGTADVLEALAAQYGIALGAPRDGPAAHHGRYWLLLPPSDPERRAQLTPTANAL